MNTITDKELKEQVIIEAKKLVKNTTKAERDKLDFDKMNPSHSKQCIYGQMTGSCYSGRATELIKQCVTKIIHSYAVNHYPQVFIESLDDEIESRFDTMQYWSPIRFEMKKKAHELEFISQINRDGSGTRKVEESYLKSMLENSLMKDTYFELHCLSMSENTYIAFNFNAFVVKLK